MHPPPVGACEPSVPCPHERSVSTKIAPVFVSANFVITPSVASLMQATPSVPSQLITPFKIIAGAITITAPPDGL